MEMYGVANRANEINADAACDFLLQSKWLFVQVVFLHTARRANSAGRLLQASADVETIADSHF